MLEYVTCPRCKLPMKELKGHIYHKQRKWTCPRCARIRMQKPGRKRMD
jgi:transposase-like protein